MDTSDMNPATLRELRAPRPYPALSVTVRTHRREPDNATDPVRLRNLVSEAHKRLHADPDVSHEARKKVGEHLDRAVAEVDLVYAQDGLVILADEHEHELWWIPREVQDRVVLSETYLTRNLVAARAQERPYWVFTVDADEVRLWSGVGEALREERAGSGSSNGGPNGGFPLRPEPLQNDAQREQRKGESSNLYSGEEVRRFLREVDTRIGRLVAARPRPYFLIGLPETLSVLGEVGRTAVQGAAGAVAKGAKQSYAEISAPELARELVGPRNRHADRQTAQALDRLVTARGGKLLAAGLDEVYRAVREGRVDELVVEEHYRVMVRIKQPASVGGRGAGGEIIEQLDPAEPTPADVHEDPQLHDDFVDEIIEAALDTDAQVSFVPDGRLAEYGSIAARLRY